MPFELHVFYNAHGLRMQLTNVHAHCYGQIYVVLPDDTSHTPHSRGVRRPLTCMTASITAKCPLAVDGGIFDNQTATELVWNHSSGLIWVWVGSEPLWRRWSEADCSR